MKYPVLKEVDAPNGLERCEHEDDLFYYLSSEHQGFAGLILIPSGFDDEMGMKECLFQAIDKGWLDPQTVVFKYWQPESQTYSFRYWGGENWDSTINPEEVILPKIDNINQKINSANAEFEVHLNQIINDQERTPVAIQAELSHLLYLWILGNKAEAERSGAVELAEREEYLSRLIDINMKDMSPDMFRYMSKRILEASSWKQDSDDNRIFTSPNNPLAHIVVGLNKWEFFFGSSDHMYEIMSWYPNSPARAMWMLYNFDINKWA